MLQTALETGLRLTMQTCIKPLLTPAMDIRLQRLVIRQAYRSSVPPLFCQYQQQALGGVPCTRVTFRGLNQGALLYLHGGAYIIGSPATHRGLTGHLAKATGYQVFCIDYRLAPEHPFPAALDDAVAAYQALLAEGYAPGSISIAGDSAGGGLTLALALRLRDEGLPLPASLVALSPWVDISNSELDTLADEPVLQTRWTSNAATLYRAEVAVDHPYVSPIHGNLTGLPPLLVQVGSDEVLLRDAQRLADKARKQGVTTTLEIYNGLWHVFQIHAGPMTRANEAIRAAAEHIKAYAGQSA
ncbi:MAG: alpha/beta hydrolase [Marinobacter sp.]|nr:alpha/beta hydrolase [Marinobacter sp.]